MKQTVRNVRSPRPSWLLTQQNQEKREHNLTLIKLKRQTYFKTKGQRTLHVPAQLNNVLFKRKTRAGWKNRFQALRLPCPTKWNVPSHVENVCLVWHICRWWVCLCIDQVTWNVELCKKLFSSFFLFWGSESLVNEFGKHFYSV